MTVKELKETLNQFDDNLIIMIPNVNWTPYNHSFQYIPAGSVTQGFNEIDRLVFIDDGTEENG